MFLACKIELQAFIRIVFCGSVNFVSLISFCLLSFVSYFYCDFIFCVRIVVKVLCRKEEINAFALLVKTC